MIEVILINWKRPENLAKIAAAFRRQSQPCRLKLCDVSTNEFRLNQETLQYFDEVFTWKRNYGCYNRFVVALSVQSEYVWFHDDDMALVRDALILPAVQAFRPEAIILQCGADGVAEDPQSRMMLSNNAHWAIVAALRHMAPRFLVLGGGGYNPWSVGRLWTGVWGVLSGQEVPGHLPPAAQAVLGALTWEGRTRVKIPPAAWVRTLRDAPRDGLVNADLRARVQQLAERLRVAA